MPTPGSAGAASLEHEASCFRGSGSATNAWSELGSVVTKDAPARSVVAGNPAQIIENDIELDELGIIRVKNYADQGDKSISRRRSASRAPVR